MKKMFSMVLSVIIVFGFTVLAVAKTDSVQVKQRTRTQGDTTVTTTDVKDKSAGISAKAKTTETETSTKTKEKIKGKNVKLESTEKETAEGIEGTIKVKAKKGAIKKLSIDWHYYVKNNNYVIDYTVKDKVDPDLLKKLNLTDEQKAMIKEGEHQIVSTSPYTPGDIKKEIQTIILKDIEQCVIRAHLGHSKRKHRK